MVSGTVAGAVAGGDSGCTALPSPPPVLLEPVELDEPFDDEVDGTVVEPADEPLPRAKPKPPFEATDDEPAVDDDFERPGCAHAARALNAPVATTEPPTRTRVTTEIRRRPASRARTAR